MEPFLKNFLNNSGEKEDGKGRRLLQSRTFAYFIP